MMACRKMFKGMASVETASLLDSTSIPATFPQEILAPIVAPGSLPSFGVNLC